MIVYNVEPINVCMCVCVFTVLPGSGVCVCVWWCSDHHRGNLSNERRSSHQRDHGVVSETISQCQGSPCREGRPETREPDTHACPCQ